MSLLKSKHKLGENGGLEPNSFISQSSHQTFLSFNYTGNLTIAVLGFHLTSRGHWPRPTSFQGVSVPMTGSDRSLYCCQSTWLS